MIPILMAYLLVACMFAYLLIIADSTVVGTVLLSACWPVTLVLLVIFVWSAK